MAQIVKKLPVMQEMRVWSLGHEDPLEKALAPSRDWGSGGGVSERLGLG